MAVVVRYPVVKEGKDTKSLAACPVSGRLTGPAYDFFAGARELMLAAFFSRNFKYRYHHNVELSRKTKGAAK
jgi:hypothetical protein